MLTIVKKSFSTKYDFMY